MDLFATLIRQAEDIAGKAGVSPDQVKSIGDMVQAKMGDGSSQLDALEAAAREHGLPVEKVQEIFAHAGNSGELMGELGSLAGGLFKG
jgi:hypothetical protein